MNHPEKRRQDCVASGGSGTEAAPSETTAKVTGWGSNQQHREKTGTIICCCQYDTAIPRCRERGIDNKSKVMLAD